MENNAKIWENLGVMTCNICNLKFSDVCMLRVHTCRKMDKTKCLRTATVKYKADTDQYLCCICSFEAEKDDFLEHLQQHLVTHPFKCDVCKKGFRTRPLITKHCQEKHVSSDGLFTLRISSLSIPILHCAKTKGDYSYTPVPPEQESLPQPQRQGQQNDKSSVIKHKKIKKMDKTGNSTPHITRMESSVMNVTSSVTSSSHSVSSAVLMAIEGTNATTTSSRANDKPVSVPIIDLCKEKEVNVFAAEASQITVKAKEATDCQTPTVTTKSGVEIISSPVPASTNNFVSTATSSSSNPFLLFSNSDTSEHSKISNSKDSSPRVFIEHTTGSSSGCSGKTTLCGLLNKGVNLSTSGVAVTTAMHTSHSSISMSNQTESPRLASFNHLAQNDTHRNPETGFCKASLAPKAYPSSTSCQISNPSSVRSEPFLSSSLQNTHTVPANGASSNVFTNNNSNMYPDNMQRIAFSSQHLSAHVPSPFWFQRNINPHYNGFHSSSTANVYQHQNFRQTPWNNHPSPMMPYPAYPLCSPNPFPYGGNVFNHVPYTPPYGSHPFYSPMNIRPMPPPPNYHCQQQTLANASNNSIPITSAISVRTTAPVQDVFRGSSNGSALIHVTPSLNENTTESNLSGCEEKSDHRPTSSSSMPSTSPVDVSASKILVTVEEPNCTESKSLGGDFVVVVDSCQTVKQEPFDHSFFRVVNKVCLCLKCKEKFTKCRSFYQHIHAHIHSSLKDCCPSGYSEECPLLNGIISDLDEKSVGQLNDMKLLEACVPNENHPYQVADSVKFKLENSASPLNNVSIVKDCGEVSNIMHDLAFPRNNQLRRHSDDSKGSDCSPKPVRIDKRHNSAESFFQDNGNNLVPDVRPKDDLFGNCDISAPKIDVRSEDIEKYYHILSAEISKDFYKCCFQNCTFSSHKSVEFLTHTEYCHGHEAEFVCAYCGYKGEKVTDLVHHIAVHNSNSSEKYSCSVIVNDSDLEVKSEQKQDALIGFLKEKYGLNKNSQYRCNICERTLSSISELKRHFQFSALKTNGCRYCNSTFLDSASFENHLAEMHPKCPKYQRVNLNFLCLYREINSCSFNRLIQQQIANGPDCDANQNILKKSANHEDLPPISIEAEKQQSSNGNGSLPLSSKSLPPCYDNNHNLLPASGNNQISVFQEDKSSETATDNASITFSGGVIKKEPTGTGDLEVKSPLNISKNEANILGKDTELSPSSHFTNESVFQAVSLCNAPTSHSYSTSTSNDPPASMASVSSHEQQSSSGNKLKSFNFIVSTPFSSHAQMTLPSQSFPSTSSCKESVRIVSSTKASGISAKKSIERSEISNNKLSPAGSCSKLLSSSKDQSLNSCAISSSTSALTPSYRKLCFSSKETSTSTVAACVEPILSPPSMKTHLFSPDLKALDTSSHVKSHDHVTLKAQQPIPEPRPTVTKSPLSSVKVPTSDSHKFQSKHRKEKHHTKATTLCSSSSKPDSVMKRKSTSGIEKKSDNKKKKIDHSHHDSIKMSHKDLKETESSSSSSCKISDRSVLTPLSAVGSLSVTSSYSIPEKSSTTKSSAASPNCPKSLALVSNILIKITKTNNSPAASTSSIGSVYSLVNKSHCLSFVNRISNDKKNEINVTETQKVHHNSDPIKMLSKGYGKENKTEIVSYGCKICSYTCEWNETEMTRHIADKHKLFACWYCGNPYSELAHLKNHIKYEHSNQSFRRKDLDIGHVFARQVQKNTSLCFRKEERQRPCPKSKKKVLKLKEGRKSVHIRVCPTPSQSQPELVGPTLKETLPGLQGDASVKEVALIQDITSEENLNFQGPILTDSMKSIVSSPKIKKSYDLKKKEKFGCIHCPLFFSAIATVQSHCIEIHGEIMFKWIYRPINCVFSSSGKLLEGRVDIAEIQNKRFLCSLCTYRSSNRATIHKHQHVIHPEDTKVSVVVLHGFNNETKSDEPINESKDATENCGTTDVIIRKEPARYNCHLCSARLSTEFLLRSHLAKHGGFPHMTTLSTQDGVPFCAQCGYIAGSTIDLANHVATHVTDRRYKCSLCNWEDHRKKAIERHIRRRHGHDSKAKVYDRERKRKNVNLNVVNLSPVIKLKRMNYD